MSYLKVRCELRTYYPTDRACLTVVYYSVNFVPAPIGPAAPSPLGWTSP